MNAFRILSCFLLISSSGFCFAEHAFTGFYRGNAGAVIVNVCFKEESSVYYAENSGKSIELLTMDSPTIKLMESRPYQVRFPEDYSPESDNVWELEKQGEKLTGNRHLAKDDGGGTEIISLQKIAESCEPEYEQHRLSLPFKKETKTKVNGVDFQSLVHPVTGVKSVLIVSGLPEAATEKINQKLAEYAEEFNSMWIDCSDWDGSITPRFVSSLWIVFDAETSGYCGGFHPNEDSTAVSFFSQTGEPVDFRPWIPGEYWTGGIQGKLKAELSREVEDEGCIEKQEKLGWEYFQPWMGPDAFFFRLDETDRAYVYCEGDYGISFDKMREFIDESYLSQFDQFVATAKQIQQPK